ncbi:MAG: transposase [Nitrospirota bacterium]|nr:transposase [Nitrospirota bacterium]
MFSGKEIFQRSPVIFPPFFRVFCFDGDGFITTCLASPEAHAQGCVRAQGFSLHADTQCGPHQREKLERLCRYITRPALGHKRLRRTAAGEVVLQLKTPYPDGTTHLVMTPLEFLQRLAALVPRPRLHLIRFHGVLAPNAALRSQIVPGDRVQAPATTDGDGETPTTSTRARMSWAQLLKRVFAIDLTACPQCGGPLTILAAIEDPAVIIKILTHLGLPTRAPPKAPARLDAFLHTA